MTINWITELANNLSNICLIFLNWLWNDATVQQILLIIYFDISFTKVMRRLQRNAKKIKLFDKDIFKLPEIKPYLTTVPQNKKKEQQD